MSRVWINLAAGPQPLRPASGGSTVHGPPGAPEFDHAPLLLRLRGSGNCQRRIFAERFDEAILATRARRTARLDCVVHHLGLALGGRPAASFAQRLMLPVSNDTLLRVVRRRSRLEAKPLAVAGIGDWAAAGFRSAVELSRRLRTLGFRTPVRPERDRKVT